MTFEIYFKSFPSKTQKCLQMMRRVISEAAPEAVETFSYGIPTFDLNGKHLVHFAGFGEHVGFYPTPSAIDRFKNKLEKFKHTKGAIQFPLNLPLPYDLVAEIVKFRVEEVLEHNAKLK